MSDLTTSASGARARQFVLGQEFQGTILTTAAETDGRHDLTECLQPPGARTPVHLHTRYQERFWVISGSLIMWVGAEKLVLRAGDFHAIPMNVPHAVESGPEGAHVLHISSPAGFAELIARAGTSAHLGHPETEMDLERFMAVTTELGDVVLGPPVATPADLADGGGAPRPGSPG